MFPFSVLDKLVSKLDKRASKKETKEHGYKKKKRVLKSPSKLSPPSSASSWAVVGADTSGRGTPSTSDRRTPSTSDRHTPSTSDRHTPSTSDRHTPSTSDQHTPAASHSRSHLKRQLDLPESSESEDLSTDSEMSSLT